MKLLFEKSVPGRGMDILPPLDVPDCPLEAGLARETALRLPQMARATSAATTGRWKSAPTACATAFTRSAPAR